MGKSRDRWLCTQSRIGKKVHVHGKHPCADCGTSVHSGCEWVMTHKECNACRNRLGLKPILSNKNKNKSQPGCHKSKQKGNDNTTGTQQDNLDIRLTNEEISNIMRANDSTQAMKEHTAWSIHSQAMNCLTTMTPSQQPGTLLTQHSMVLKDQNPNAYLQYD